MEIKLCYAYGEACCLLICSEDLASIVKRAKQEGYGFVVLYRTDYTHSRIHRRIIAWDCDVMGYEQALKHTKDPYWIKALYDWGCRLFLKAPLPQPGMVDIFPFKWFDSFIRLSEKELSALLK